MNPILADNFYIMWKYPYEWIPIENVQNNLVYTEPYFKRRFFYPCKHKF